MTFHELCCDVSQICVITSFSDLFQVSPFYFGWVSRPGRGGQRRLSLAVRRFLSFLDVCLFVVFHDKYPELKLGKYLRVLAKV